MEHKNFDEYVATINNQKSDLILQVLPEKEQLPQYQIRLNNLDLHRHFLSLWKTELTGTLPDTFFTEKSLTVLGHKLLRETIGTYPHTTTFNQTVEADGTLSILAENATKEQKAQHIKDKEYIHEKHFRELLSEFITPIHAALALDYQATKAAEATAKTAEQTAKEAKEKEAANATEAQIKSDIEKQRADAAVARRNKFLTYYLPLICAAIGIFIATLVAIFVAQLTVVPAIIFYALCGGLIGAGLTLVTVGIYKLIQAVRNLWNSTMHLVTTEIPKKLTDVKDEIKAFANKTIEQVLATVSEIIPATLAMLRRIDQAGHDLSRSANNSDQNLQFVQATIKDTLEQFNKDFETIKEKITTAALFSNPEAAESAINDKIKAIGAQVEIFANDKITEIGVATNIGLNAKIADIKEFFEETTKDTLEKLQETLRKFDHNFDHLTATTNDKTRTISRRVGLIQKDLHSVIERMEISLKNFDKNFTSVSQTINEAPILTAGSSVASAGSTFASFAGGIKSFFGGKAENTIIPPYNPPLEEVPLQLMDQSISTHNSKAIIPYGKNRNEEKKHDAPDSSRNTDTETDADDETYHTADENTGNNGSSPQNRRSSSSLD